MSSAIKSVSSNKEYVKKERDKFDHFADYLACELRELSSENATILMENISVELIQFKRALRK